MIEAGGGGGGVAVATVGGGGDCVADGCDDFATTGDDVMEGFRSDDCEANDCCGCSCGTLSPMSCFSRQYSTCTCNANSVSVCSAQIGQMNVGADDFVVVVVVVVVAVCGENGAKLARFCGG